MRATDEPLKVLLLEAGPGGGRHHFYAEPAPEDEAAPPDDAPPPRGLRERAEARFCRLKARWRDPEGRMARWGRLAWDWLHTFAHPDEPLLARLRSAHAVELHHPESLTAEEAVAAWEAFLAAGGRRHWPWFVVNLLIAPASALLAVLPGPNLVGYWFAYRALHHALILHGLRKARTGRVETRLRPTGLLARGRPHEAAHLVALGCDPEAVGEFLRRHGARGRRGKAVGAPGGG